MRKIVEDYMDLISRWIDRSELDAFDITDADEYEDMQDRIIMMKHHLTMSKAILNRIKEAESEGRG